jgi:ABC-type transporter Mla maintaining outer membrane lipid asymmetry ATPase subunit MlaF
MGLYEKKDNPVKTFSLGMRKRLLLCLALLSEPRGLFIDEPTSGLDVQSARLIRAMLRDLRKEGKAIVLTTNNMDEASELCDRGEVSPGVRQRCFCSCWAVAPMVEADRVVFSAYLLHRDSAILRGRDELLSPWHELGGSFHLHRSVLVGRGQTSQTHAAPKALV